jgi:putative transposase
MPILVHNIDLYETAINRTCERFEIDIIAWVVLPDHMHLVLEPKDNDVSDVMKVFKQDFGFLYRRRIGVRGGRVWQLRFWDHVIRDQDDMNRHIDYIHYNPVKHGLVKSAKDYAHSSFADYVRKGFYRLDWGGTEEVLLDGEFGE